MSELDLNAEMAESAKIMSDPTPDAIRKLGNAAYRAGMMTGRSNAEIASAVFHLASDGVDLDQTIEALEGDPQEYLDE